jgi:hypothetical protein
MMWIVDSENEGFSGAAAKTEASRKYIVKNWGFFIVYG